MKIHDELEWSYLWDEPMQPWRVRGDQVDVTMTPFFDRYDNTDLKVVKMEVISRVGGLLAYSAGCDMVLV